MRERITPDYLRGIVARIADEVTAMGFTKIQLCQEAGLNKDTLPKAKNPTIGTIIKLIEARDRLKKKLETA